MVGGNKQETGNIASISRSSAESSACYRYLTGIAHLDPLLLENVPFDSRNEASLRSAKFRKIGSGPGEFVEILGSDPANEDRNSGASIRLLQSLPLADVDFLVQSFFEVVHPAFPILDEYAFRKLYETRSVEALLLTAVCVVAGVWLSATRRMPKEVNLSNTEVILGEQLKVSLERPSITSIQAGLLLLQCPNHTSQQFSSHLTSSAFDLGLHRDCSDWKLDQNEISSRKRLAWALYAQDKWMALMHGRPAQMTEANWMVPQLTENDFDITTGTEETSAPLRKHSALLFIQMLLLSQLLSEILETFYTLTAEASAYGNPHNGLRLVLSRAKPVQIKLKDWFSHLPATLKMDAPTSSLSAYNGVLHLTYFATEIALHRCIIRASATPHTDPYVKHICRSAAKTRLISSMDFVNRLRPSHFQASAWPFASVANFGLIASFGVLLRATAPTREEEAFYKARLDEYSWTLGVSCREVGFLEGAVGVVERSCEVVGYGPEKPGVQELREGGLGVFQGGGQVTSDLEGSSIFTTARGREDEEEEDEEAFDGFSSPATEESSELDLEANEST